VVLSPQAPGPFAAATLRAHAALGTVIHPIDGWDGRREAVRAMRELGERDGVEPLVIPMGGTSATGAVGYVNAAFELAEQVPPSALITSPADAEPMWPDVVYVPGGTLGTAIGLAIGFAALERAGARPAPRVEAIRVTPGEVANIGFAERLVAGTVALLRTHDQTFPAFTLAELRFELRDEFFAPGYGVVTPETSSAVGRAADAGIKLETTYTGKALVALLADSVSRRLGAHEHVLFWDTYHSGEMPPPGSADALPDPLPAYIAECDRLFTTP
jgi:D-cysteine desulfhydrase